MASHHIGITFLRLGDCAPHHLVRYRVRKEDNEIRRANLISQLCRHLCEHLRLAVVLLTNLFVLADHAIMSAHNHDAHDLHRRKLLSEIAARRKAFLIRRFMADHALAAHNRSSSRIHTVYPVAHPLSVSPAV